MVSFSCTMWSPFGSIHLEVAVTSSKVQRCQAILRNEYIRNVDDFCCTPCETNSIGIYWYIPWRWYCWLCHIVVKKIGSGTVCGKSITVSPDVWKAQQAAVEFPAVSTTWNMRSQVTRVQFSSKISHYSWKYIMGHSANKGWSSKLLIHMNTINIMRIYIYM